MKDLEHDKDWFRNHIAISSKKSLEDAMIEIKFAELKGADLMHTRNLIEWLITAHKEYYIDFK